MLGKIMKDTYNVAIYIRLSKEDEDRGVDESESIINQRAFLVDYVKRLGWQYSLVDIYIDQGFTGTNFNRPGFQRMINDIRDDKINMVVTKDLSRLGRDYIETGEYLEKWFPDHNVRYISVTDGIDTFETLNGNNDIAPFKAVLNDMYSKDLSKKIRTALHTMQKAGKWVGSSVAIGYMRDPNNKNKLVICEEEAEIVRAIFNMAYAGNDLGTIRNYLNNNKIPTVRRLRYNKTTYWENKTIKNILKNELYIGTSIQNRRSRVSYKNRRLRSNPQSEWIVVENTHEPIIDKKIFDQVQKMLITQNYNRNEKKHHFLLDGLLICYECKHKIGFRCGKDGRTSLVCNNYRRNSKLGVCSSHGFNYEKLENTVLNYIKTMFLEINSNRIELNIKNRRKEHDYNKKLQILEMEINNINDSIDKMYVDKLNEKISEEMYERLFDKLKAEIKQKEKEYNNIKEVQKDAKKDNTNTIKKLINKFLELEEPTPEIMRVIINRIEVHKDKQLDIIFNFSRLNDVKINPDEVTQYHNLSLKN